MEAATLYALGTIAADAGQDASINRLATMYKLFKESAVFWAFRPDAVKGAVILPGGCGYRLR